MASIYSDTKYAGSCRVCFGPITAGQEYERTRSGGAIRHAACVEPEAPAVVVPAGYARIESAGRMSNGAVHRNGGVKRTLWWARYTDADGATKFLALPSTRGDERLAVTVRVPEGVREVQIGCGPNNRDGVRETISIPEAVTA